MLSKKDILFAIKKKELKVKPFDQAMLLPNSLKIRLDNEFAIAKGGEIDPHNGKDFSEFYGTVRLKPKEKIMLKPNQFLLARTMESLSISNGLSALVHGRSTLARMGLAVTQTAPVIQSGHGVPKMRKIVLEMSNSGPFDIVLTPGMKIGQLIFFRLDTPVDKLYDSFGRYGKRKEKDALTPLKE
jgi:dCTP deaminase